MSAALVEGGLQLNLIHLSMQNLRHPLRLGVASLGLASAAAAVPIDLSGATPSIVDSETMRIDQIETLGSSYWAEFGWSKSQNNFGVNRYGQEVEYEIIDLGTLGGTNSWATAINDHGVIVGMSQTAGDTETAGFIFQDGVMSLVEGLGGPYSALFDINNEGVAAGMAFLEGWVGARALTFADGVTTPLSTLGGSLAASYAIASGGFVAGSSGLEGDTVQHSTLWENGEIRDLGSFAELFYSVGRGVNSHGVVVGESINATNDTIHAYVTEDGIMKNLGTFGGANAVLADIDVAGRMCGSTFVNESWSHTAGKAFVVENGVATFLGALGGGDSYACALGANGQVVGEAEAPGDTISYAFLYEHGVMRALPSLGGSASTAGDINAHGAIVGWSSLPDDTATHAFIAIPRAR